MALYRLRVCKRTVVRPGGFFLDRYCSLNSSSASSNLPWPEYMSAKGSNVPRSARRHRNLNQPIRSFPAYLAIGSPDKAYYRGDILIRTARIVRTPLAKRASDHLPLVVDFHLGHSNGRG